MKVFRLAVPGDVWVKCICSSVNERVSDSTGGIFEVHFIHVWTRMSELKNYIHTWVRTLNTVMGCVPTAVHLASFPGPAQFPLLAFFIHAWGESGNEASVHPGQCFHTHLILKITIELLLKSLCENFFGYNVSGPVCVVCNFVSFLVLPKLGKWLYTRTTFNVGSNPCGGLVFPAVPSLWHSIAMFGVSQDGR